MTVVAAPKDVIAEANSEAEQAYADYQRSAELTAKAEKLVGKRIGQCVMALRNHFGVPYAEIRGAAKSNKPNSDTGKVGAVVIFNSLSRYGHVAIIIADNGDSWKIFHSNMDFKGTGRIDTISKTDPRITGYKIINYQ